MPKISCSCLAAFVTVLLTLTTWAAPGKSAVLSLAGKTFADGQDVNVTSADLLLPSPRYDYEISATITGSGALAAVVGQNTPLADFLELIKPGSSDFLQGSVLNKSGKLPFLAFLNKTIEGEVSVGPFTLSASLVLTAGIAADGTPSFSVANVTLVAPFPLGSITFGANSKMTIGNDLLGTDGKYAGLFVSVAGTPETTGIINLTVDKLGKYTGALVIAGKQRAFKGAFDATGATLPIELIKPGVATLNLSLNPTFNSISGTVTGAPAGAFLAAKAAYTKTSPFAAPGTYNVLLPSAGLGGGLASDVPQGTGFGTAKISADGSVALVFALPDKTKATGKGLLTSGNQLVFAIPLYQKAGILVGTLQASPGLATPSLGAVTMRWAKPAITGTKLFLNGFDTSPTLTGERYAKIALPSPLSFSATFGNLGAGAIQQQIVIDQITSKATVPLPNAQSVKVTLKVSNGLFSGSFKTFTAPAKTIKFSGLILPNTFAGAAGFFIGVPPAGTLVESGLVTLQ